MENCPEIVLDLEKFVMIPNKFSTQPQIYSHNPRASYILTPKKDFSSKTFSLQSLSVRDFLFLGTFSASNKVYLIHHALSVHELF